LGNIAAQILWSAMEPIRGAEQPARSLVALPYSGWGKFRIQDQVVSDSGPNRRLVAEAELSPGAVHRSVIVSNNEGGVNVKLS
jgi:hypothetical protein